jgi:hypothetical protein
MVRPKGDNAKHPRADALGNAPDGAALAGRGTRTWQSGERIGSRFCFTRNGGGTGGTPPANSRKRPRTLSGLVLPKNHESCAQRKSRLKWLAKAMTLSHRFSGLGERGQGAARAQRPEMREFEAIQYRKREYGRKEWLGCRRQWHGW